MPPTALAHPFLKRLPRFQTAASWTNVARNPSRFAPRPEDVQPGPPFEPPGPVRVETSEEFKAVQTRIADAIRAGEEPPVELFDRDRELLAANGERWAALLAPWGAKDLVYRRGLVNRLSLSGRSFISIGKTLFDSVPLRGVRLVAVKWFLNELANCEHLGRLERLDLSGNRIGRDGLRTVLESPFVGRVTRWNLAGNDLTSEAIAGLPPGIRRLSVAGNGLRTIDLSRFPDLETLDLSENPQGPTIGPFPNVRRLNVAECGQGPAGVGRLANETLREFDVSFNGIGNGSVRVIAGTCPELRVLSLRGNRLTTKAFEVATFPNLRRLDLAANFLGDEIVRHLTRERFPKLTSLDLTNTLLTDRSVNELRDSGLFDRLRELNLSWNAISARAAKALRNAAGACRATMPIVV